MGTGTCWLGPGRLQSSHFLRCTLPEQGFHRGPHPHQLMARGLAVEAFVISCPRRAPSNVSAHWLFSLNSLWLNSYLMLLLSSLIATEIRISGCCRWFGCLLLQNSYCSHHKQKESLLEVCWKFQESLRDRETFDKRPRSRATLESQKGRQHNRSLAKKLWLCYRNCHYFCNCEWVLTVLFSLWYLFKIQSLAQKL